MKLQYFRKVSQIVRSVALVACVTGTGLATASPALPSYKVDLSQTSVSGLSSGAFMAAQFSVAYSSTVVGEGIVAGGPFYCSGYPGVAPYIPYQTNAMTVCMNPTLIAPDAKVLVEQAKLFAKLGQIDDFSHVKNQKVYLFSGKADKTVTTVVVDQTEQFYKIAGVAEKNIRYIKDIDAGHAIITPNKKDVACATTSAPYINDCDFSQAQDILNHIYDNLKPPVKKLSGKIIKFNQREFVHSLLSSMSEDAYAYVPKACTKETCKVHVAFHGCEQGAKVIDDLFYAKTGYNELADANNIIVLYPQAEPSYMYPFNPKGCWDFWGYTSVNPFLPNFYTKQAPQMAAVKAMLDRLGAPRK